MDSIVLEESPSTTAYGGTGGGRAIDRHNPIIRDEKRLTQGRIFPFTSNITQPANSPHHHKKKSPETAKKHQEQVAGGGDRKKKSVVIAGGTGDDNELINPNDFISPATSSRYLLSDRATFNFSSEFDHVPPPPPPPPREPLVFHNYSKIFEKKDDDSPSSPPPTQLPPPSPPPTEGLTLFDDDDDYDDDSPSYSPPKPPPPPPPPLEFHNYKASNKIHQNSSYSATRKPPSPPPPPPPPPPPKPLEFHNYKASNKKFEDSSSSATRKPPSPPPPPPPSSDQVVVLEVSLHCRGCERKMRKHISKIEGVTSFKIEFAAKKVTVVGDVTPLAVLTSVLKVKNAKLLNPATISSTTSTADHSNH